MIGESKVTQIRMLTVEGRPRDAGELRAGEIGVIYGLSNVRAGDVCRATRPCCLAACPGGAVRPID